MKMILDEKYELKHTFKSLGLVFGDIGTSPIYTFTVIFFFLANEPDNIIGVVSLIIWTLTSLVTLKYVWLAMSLSKKGEGGTVVLLELLIPLLKKSRSIMIALFLAYLGVSLLIGDGVITPAMSILSAVEGVRLIPGFGHVPQDLLVLVAAVIAIVLLCYQKKGTERVAGTFAPIMLIWFILLFLFGFIYVIKYPGIFRAVSPYYALDFLFNHGYIGFFTLSEVVLCATGGEALYADMGHLKRRPITQAWVFVFIALMFNYLGQAAYLIENPNTKNILFGMVYHQASFIYVPFLVLTVLATVIASQAMITGIFSIVYQAINVRLLPMLRINYTSDKIKGQIYIPAVNWFLLAFILIIMFHFKSSDKLASAYGLAVTGAMVFAGVMMIMIFYLTKKYLKFHLAIFATFVATVFFASTLLKIPTGGYWSILISCIPLFIILIYTFGQKKLFKKLNPIPKEDFLQIYNREYHQLSQIEGTALYFVRDTNFIPPYIMHNIFKNGILYKENIFVSIIRREGPWGIHYCFRNDMANGIRVFEIRLGYMETEKIADILKEAGIKERVIFYGLEDIVTNNFIWRIFSVMKKLIPSYVQFYRLPPTKLHGVVTRIEM